MPEVETSSASPIQVQVALGERAYDILIGRGILDTAGAEISRRMPGVRAAVVTDETVADRHLAKLESSLKSAGIDYSTIVVKPGEESKSFATLTTVVDGVLAARLERNDVVVAFGGGVVGDLAGFTAAIVRRGMHVVQIPTTLLAQVDSSVGGKTGINTSYGKNLVGSFHQPQLVLADSAVLDTLPRRVFNAGYAEIAKMALIKDAPFFSWLEQNWPAMVAGGAEREEAIATACRAKAATVAADEREHGERALLNLGHTFGHALEAATGYSDRLLHGEGVSIGMVLAHDFSVERGLAPASDAERVLKHLEAIGLPTRISQIPGEPLSPEALVDHIAQDKKVTRGKLNFILTRGIGQAFIAKDIPREDVQEFLTRQAAR